MTLLYHLSPSFPFSFWSALHFPFQLTKSVSLVHYTIKTLNFFPYILFSFIAKVHKKVVTFTVSTFSLSIFP